MTADERQKIVAQLAILNEYANDTEKNVRWHAGWQVRYQQVTAYVLSLGEPKEGEPEPEGKPKPKAATGAEHLKGSNGK